MIDLGSKYDNGPCAPSTMGKEAPKVSYPTLYFTCSEECECPDEGTATIKFRKVEDAENTRDPADPKYRYELEVQGIEFKGGEKMDMGSKLKTAMRQKMKKGEYEDGE